MMMTRIWEWIEEGLEWVQQSPSTTLLWASFGVVSATSLLLYCLRLKLRKPDTILLTGLSGSGKTVLFYQLRDGCCQQETVQSQEPNEESFILHSETSWNSKLRPVHVVDLPGDPRFQSTMDGFLCKAAGIVCVVDATEISWNCNSVSKYVSISNPKVTFVFAVSIISTYVSILQRYLYEILTKAIVVKKKIPVLILCNKTDKLTAHSKEFIARQPDRNLRKTLTSRCA